MTVGIYIRVSKQEQALEGYSIDAQKERLTSYCKAQGWTDYRFYIEEGISGKDTNRPKLKLLMDHIKGGQIKTLLVYRLDRLTRSVIDLHKLLKFLQDHNCAFKSATEMYDTTTANGRMFMGIVALLAQWESENMSERIKMALEQKVSEGERVGNIPYGFDLNEDEKLVKNEKSSIVLEMVEKVKNGWSLNRIANYLNLINNDREWRANTILRILRNPAIYGATRWNDKVFENTHEGIITKEEFLKLQQILDDRAMHHRRDVKSTYLFQGVLICPSCGRPLSVNRFIRKRKDGSEWQSAVYRCQVCMKEGKNVSSIGELRFVKALKEYMKNVKIKPVEIEQENDEKDLYFEQMKQIERKREKYQRAWAADLISDEEFEQRMSETRKAYDELKKKLEELEDVAKIDPEQLKNIIFTFNETFDYLTQEEKKVFISRFIRKIYFKAIPNPPTRPDRYKKGKPKIVITDIEFY